jgi:acetyl-CoA C-acetyltransferase
MANADPIVIAAAARTPIGSFQGEFKDVAAKSLGATAAKAALTRSGIEAEDIEEVILGCVLSAGQGQAPARQAALAAGMPAATPCTTVNKMCGSGMKAIMLLHDILRAGSARIGLAGGMESMSNAPYLLDRARSGYRMGHGRLFDHMFLDGLEDAYDQHLPMGAFAEECAERFQFTRAAQDAFAIASLERGQRAIGDGSFEKEIAPVTVKTGTAGAKIVLHDEQPLKAKLDKIPHLKPAFRKGGSVTAANSSSISDGAAALVLMRRSEAEKRGVAPLAAIRAHATHAQAPSQFATAPIGALQKLMDKTGWSMAGVELFEINEAFAVVPMAAMHELSLPHEKVNVHGGACALGHPIGASGARIVVTLLAAMQKYGLKRGAAALCIGGGEATAIALEMPC